jgi:Zn-dependent protease with chaperone function
MSTEAIRDGSERGASFAAGAHEDFRDAIARRRRTAWRVTAACAAAYLALGLVVAVLMAPLLYSLAGLALDLVNLAVAAPDLLGVAGRTIETTFFSGKPVAAGPALRVVALAAAPGLALYVLAMFAIRRALLLSPVFERGPTRGEALGRRPNPALLAEIEIADTIEEMAVAAVVPPPRVVFVEGSLNAASFGTDADNATVLIGSALPRALTRQQMQGVAAHLVASVASGDTTVGMRTAFTLGAVTLISAFNTGFVDAGDRSATFRLMRALIAPTRNNLAFILARLSDPLADRKGTEKAPGGAKSLSWRDWVVMPLMGPLFMSGFLSLIVHGFVLGPLLTLAWRQRKYAADATAVQLTRDPNALDEALEAMGGVGAAAGLPPWAGHLCVVDPGSGGDLFGPFSIFPSIDARRRALVRLGADDDPALKRRGMPRWALAILIALAAVLFVLVAIMVYLLLVLSAALTGLFTLVPTLLIHHLLRWAAA